MGVVFVTALAMLLEKLTDIDMKTWLIIIFIYYFCATIMPIDKIIAHLYPFFGAALLIMASEMLQATLSNGGPAAVANETSIILMGTVGGFFAVIGIIILPVTSGDTAFRAARLTIAEAFSYSQTKQTKRLLIAIPLFVLGALLSQINFDIIWRYFGWANQTLATIMLWAIAAYRYRQQKRHLIASIPATFMTAVIVSFICSQKIGFSLPLDISYIIGIVAAIISLAAFLIFGRKEIA